MLAKLFDDISIASLIRSLGLAIVLFLLVFLVSGQELTHLSILNYHWELPGYWHAIIALPLLSLSVVWFNTNLIAIPLFKNDYQPAIITAILLIPVLVTQASLNIVLLMPLMVLLLLKLFSLAESPSISYLLFDSGSIIGLMLFLEPLSITMMLVVWLSLINYGRFGLKQILMPFIGLLAIWFLGSAIIYWLGGTKEVSLVYQGLVDLPFGSLPSWQDNLWRILPVAILFVPAMFQLLNVLSKAKVLQRQSFGMMLVFFTVILLTGALFYQPAGLWIWLAFPVATMIVNLVLKLNKAWMKDLVYLLLLSYLALFLF